MKNVAIIFSVLTMLISCKVIKGVKTDVVKQETLIAIHSKIPNYGILYFLKNNGDKAIFIEYEYKIYTKSKNAKCTKKREIECELNDEIIDKYMWYTADSFKKEVQIPSWEKSFNCIFENFLELTNDEKIKILDSLQSSQDELREVQLYSYFTAKGARKFELNPKFVELQRNSTNKITIDTEEVQLIKHIILTADKYKLRGDKIGVNLLYFDFIFSSDTNPRHFILVNTSAFIDLNNNCVYIVNDENNRRWLENFQNKYRGYKIN